MPLVMAVGVLLPTALMHLARGVGTAHAGFAKAPRVARPDGSEPFGAEPLTTT